MLTDTNAFVLYLIQNAPKPLTKTSLLKIAYLADVEHHRRSGRWMHHHWWWRRDKRGPVDYSISMAADRLRAGGLICVVTESFRERKRTAYHPASTSRMQIDDTSRAMADFALNRYGHLSHDELIGAAYATEPMLANPELGEFLDMTTIAPYPSPEAPPRLAARDAMRAEIVAFVAWNQRMEGIPTSLARIEAMYAAALCNPLDIPETATSE